ncbi:MAG: hypothetical protein Q9216_003723 [Gyalolechia sp. 2 TL-2023]
MKNNDIVLRSRDHQPVKSKWIWFHRQPQWLSDVELYDQASRGLRGALSMLWHIRWRDLSSLASLNVLCSMAIDPFAQQLTHLQLERIAVDFNASLPVQSLLNGKGSLFKTEVAAKAAFDGLKSDSSEFTMMNTTGTGALLKIDNVGQSLINFTKIFRNPASSNNPTGCYYEEPSYIAQCVQDIRDTTTATECSLYWCVNHYAAIYEHGTLNETVMRSWWSDSSFDIVAFNEFGLNVSDVN